MRRALPVIAALLLAWVPYRAFLGSEIPIARDLAFYFLPLKAHLAEALREGTLPWIDRYRWGGSPLLGAPGAAPFDPLNLLFVLLPLGAAVKAWILIRVATGVAGFALFARRRGLSPEGAAASGLLFGLSGPFVSFLPFLGASAAFSLLPWFALACERALERPGPRRVAPLAVVSALLLVSGAPEFLFYAALLALVLLVGAARREVAARQGAVLAGAALLAAALAAPAVVSSAAAASRSVRGAGGGMTLRAASEMSLPAARLPELALDGVTADWRTTIAARERGIAYPYLPSATPGRVALLLAAAGLLAWRRALAPLALSALGVLLALGAATPVWPAAATLFPPLLAIRYPEKHLALWGFGAAWLAVLGLKALEERLAGGRRAGAAALVALAVLADREAMARGLMPMEPPAALRSPLLDRIPPRAAPAPPPRLFARQAYRTVAGEEGSLPRLFRIHADALGPQLGSLHGAGYVFERDYDLLLPQQSFEWERLLHRAVPSGSPLVGRLLRSTGVEWVLDIEDVTGLPRLGAVPAPLSPFRFARRVVADADGRRLLRRALEEGFDPESGYVGGSVPGLGGSLAPGRVLEVRDRAEALTLTVEARGPSPSFLLLYRRLDAMEEATIDGRPVVVSDVLFGFGGLLVPPGRHEVRLRPATRPLRMGLLVTLFAIPLLAALARRP